jgi:hypothetical protein
LAAPTTQDQPLRLADGGGGGGGGALPVTTKGDLVGFDTAANRVPVGTNGQVLTADSTAALGVSYQTPGGGGSIAVTDGATTVNPAVALAFTGATVSNLGSGVAGVSVSGGGGGGVTTYFGNGPASTLHNNGDLYFDNSSVPCVGYVQSPSAPAPSVDGTPAVNQTWSGSSSSTVTVSTTDSGILMIGISIELNTGPVSITSVSSVSGLVFTRAATVNNGGVNLSNTTVEWWWAPLIAQLAAEVVTVTTNVNLDDGAIVAFGVAFASTVTPFLTGGSTGLPATAAVPSGSGEGVTGTVNAPVGTLLLSICGSAQSLSPPKTPLGFTNIATFNNGGGTLFMIGNVDKRTAALAAAISTNGFSGRAAAIAVVGVAQVSGSGIWLPFT